MGRRGLQGVDKRPENRGCGVADGDEAGASPARSGRRRGGGREAQGRAWSIRSYVRVRKVRYRGLAKNTQRIALLLGFSNLLIAGRYATG